MTLAPATVLTAAARAAGPRIHAYVMLSLCTGVRTEEARALRWEHVDFGDPRSQPPRPASVAVWRSVPARGRYQDQEIAADPRAAPAGGDRAPVTARGDSAP